MDSKTSDQATTGDHLQPEEIRRQARSLIDAQRTMVLATEERNVPWTAPVYYVYSEPHFYFFSSPRARHIRQAGSGKAVAASIFSDSDQWLDIQGLQMSGTLMEVKKPTDRLNAIARFLIKFPFSKPFLQPEAKQLKGTPAVGERVRLYAFTPQEIYLVNNRMAFGKRLPVELQRRAR